MSTERLIITIDDAELNAIIDKITTVKIGETGGVDDATKRLNELNKKIRDTQQAAKEAGINLDNLPAINRDMRLLLGSLDIPGLGELLSGYFQGRRGVTAGVKARQAVALTAEGLAPEVAKKLVLSSMVGYAALILYIVKMIYDFYKQAIKEIEASRVRYEDLMRKNQDITHREYMELSKEQIGFASWLDQFQSHVDSEGYINAIVDLVWNKILAQAPTLSDEDRRLLEQAENAFRNYTTEVQ